MHATDKVNSFPQTPAHEHVKVLCTNIAKPPCCVDGEVGVEVGGGVTRGEEKVGGRGETEAAAVAPWRPLPSVGWCQRQQSGFTNCFWFYYEIKCMC